MEIEVNEEFVVCHVGNLTERLKDDIRTHLSKICHGRSLVSRELALHNYQNTLFQFKARYYSKTDLQQKGMMGELLAHVIISEYLTDFDIISPFFNMEEKSQRKGFDLLLVERTDHEVWITEVKSGELFGDTSPDRATNNFLGIAKRDLKRRLNEPETTFWTNAINTANNVIEDCTDYKSALLKILSDEGVLATEERADSTDNNVILVSVLFSDSRRLFSSQVTGRFADNVRNEGIFNKVIAFSIQKNTYQALANFLFVTELNG